MANKDDVLREKTYKGEFQDDVHRVFYTLHDGKASRPDGGEDLQSHRNSKLLAGLTSLLVERGLITQEQLDELLFDVVH